MNEWEIVAFEEKHKTGAITVPTIRITLVHRTTGEELLAVLQRMSRVVYRWNRDGSCFVLFFKSYDLPLIHTASRIRTVSPATEKGQPRTGEFPTEVSPH